MITPSDREYKATKRIKQARTRVAPPFDELRAWIGSTWQVTVLNVIYDPANGLHAPRLKVIVEHQEDTQRFRDGYNFDKAKQDAVASKFLEIISTEEADEYNVDGLFVVFSAFAPIAKEEADSRLSEEEVEALKTRIANPDLWVIHRCYGQVTFMFYIDAQARAYEAKGQKELYARMYFEILKPYDEFGYLEEEEFAVSFDSKQNFDDNYGSNWYWYCK